MRKLILTTTVLFLSLATFIACNKSASKNEKDQSMIPISHESLGYDIGIVHNEMMRDAKDYDGFNFSSITSALASIETF